jgi:hypothetical protein
MGRFQKAVLVIASLALIISFAVWRKARLELQADRQQLRTLTVANEAFRKTLGDMAVALAAKDKEIMRLKRTGCERQENARPSLPGGPGRRKISEPTALRLEMQ